MEMIGHEKGVFARDDVSRLTPPGAKLERIVERVTAGPRCCFVNGPRGRFRRNTRTTRQLIGCLLFRQRSLANLRIHDESATLPIRNGKGVPSRAKEMGGCGCRPRLQPL